MMQPFKKRDSQKDSPSKMVVDFTGHHKKQKLHIYLASSPFLTVLTTIVPCISFHLFYLMTYNPENF